MKIWFIRSTLLTIEYLEKMNMYFLNELQSLHSRQSWFVSFVNIHNTHWRFLVSSDYMYCYGLPFFRDVINIFLNCISSIFSTSVLHKVPFIWLTQFPHRQSSQTPNMQPKKWRHLWNLSFCEEIHSVISIF